MECRVEGAVEDELAKACLSPKCDTCHGEDGYFKGICEVQMATKRLDMVNCEGACFGWIEDAGARDADA